MAPGLYINGASFYNFDRHGVVFEVTSIQGLCVVDCGGFYYWTEGIKNQIFIILAITPKRLTSGRAHLRNFAPELHSSLETSQCLRAIGDTVYDLTGPGIEPQIFRTCSYVLNN